MDNHIEEYITVSKDFEPIDLNELPDGIGVDASIIQGNTKILREIYNCVAPKLTMKRLDKIIGEAQDNLDKLIKLRDELK